MKAAGLIRLQHDVQFKDYMKNPIVLWSFDSTAPIGRCTKLYLMARNVLGFRVDLIGPLEGGSDDYAMGIGGVVTEASEDDGVVKVHSMDLMTLSLMPKCMEVNPSTVVLI